VSHAILAIFEYLDVSQSQQWVFTLKSQSRHAPSNQLKSG